MYLTASKSSSWVIDLDLYPQNGTYMFTYM